MSPLQHLRMPVSPAYQYKNRPEGLVPFLAALAMIHYNTWETPFLSPLLPFYPVLSRFIPFYPAGAKKKAGEVLPSPALFFNGFHSNVLLLHSHSYIRPYNHTLVLCKQHSMCYKAFLKCSCQKQFLYLCFRNTYKVLIYLCIFQYSILLFRIALPFQFPFSILILIENMSYSSLDKTDRKSVV